MSVSPVAGLIVAIDILTSFGERTCQTVFAIQPATIVASVSTAAQLMVKCLENEGVAVVFGIPGEENIRFVQALAASDIRYVLTRHEQAAAFMAEMYGRVTGRAAVVSSTLGPGAINMQLGVADATTGISLRDSGG